MEYLLIMIITTHHWFTPNDINITKVQFSSSLACEEARGPLLMASAMSGMADRTTIECISRSL